MTIEQWLYKAIEEAIDVIEHEKKHLLLCQEALGALRAGESHWYLEEIQSDMSIEKESA